MQGRVSKQSLFHWVKGAGLSPLMQGRGSKPCRSPERPLPSWSPLMQGRGSKLPILRPEVPGGQGRPSCRGVDRNRDDRGTRAKPKVAPHAGAWIETRSASSRQMASWVAPHAGAWIETRSEGVHSLTEIGRASFRERGGKYG